VKFKSVLKKIFEVISLPQVEYFLLMEKYIVSFAFKTDYKQL